MDQVTDSLAKRDTCRDSFGRFYRCNRGWNNWGRWVLVGAAFLVFFVFLLALCCIARRRRKRGGRPYYGTGWMAPVGKYGGPNGSPNGGRQSYSMNGQQSGYYNTGDNQQAGAAASGGFNPPPAYGTQNPEYTGTTFNANDGYHTNTQYNTGLQSPPNAYQRDGVYQPNPAPPQVGK